MDGHCTLHSVVNARHRQASLVADHGFRAGPDDLGVDQHLGLVALFRNVDHHHTFVDINLRGGQTNAVGVVHGVEHVGHQLAHARIHHSDRARHGVQTGIGITKNGENGHCIRGEYFVIFATFAAPRHRLGQ